MVVQGASPFLLHPAVTQQKGEAAVKGVGMGSRVAEDGQQSVSPALPISKVHTVHVSALCHQPGQPEPRGLLFPLAGHCF